MIQAVRVDSARQPKPPSLPEPRWESPETRANLRDYLASDEGRTYVAGLRVGAPAEPAPVIAARCKRGHELSEENLRWHHGYARCRQCDRETEQVRRDKRKAMKEKK